jgi:hypothetical protein
MIADANSELEKYKKEQIKKGNAKPNSMGTFLSGCDCSKLRNGEQQALEVLAKKSDTCNSSHMADKARHVGPKLDGKVFDSMSKFKKALKSDDDYACFVEIYGAAMKKQGLRNFGGGEGFLHASKDPLHLELLNSRLPSNHPEIEKCRLAYAKATRKEGQPKNSIYEKVDKAWLEAYDKANPQPAAEGEKK